jgi:putative ABC transport system permease protein
MPTDQAEGGRPAVEALRLALRGMRWRTGPSLAVLVVAVVAMAGAALGPLYAHSSQESLVRDGLTQSPPVTTGVQSLGNVAGQTQFSPAQLTKAVEERAADPALDPWYRPATLSLTVLEGAPSVQGHQLGLAQVSWYRGQCGAVTVVTGHCPDGASQAMVSSRTATSSGVRLGTVIRLGITSDPTVDRVTVVGTYDPATADPAVWGLAIPSQYAPGRIEGSPDRLDEIVVDQATMLRSNGDVAVVTLRAIDPAAVHLDDLPALRDAVVKATAVPDPTAGTGPRTLSVSGLTDYLDALAPQLQSVSAASFAVTAQLVLLAWFVLFLIISSTSEERSGEIALAKLRGMTPRATVSFGLAESLILLVLAVPLGLLLAYAADLLLASRYLVAGTTVALTPSVLVALGVCFLGGAAAAALAARGILTAPVLEQLRRTGGRRARLVRSTAVDAATVALAAAGVYELRRGGSDSLALLAPGLIALAAGLLAVRALPWAARIEVSRTRGSSSVASFLSSRNIARRPGGLRIVVLLSLAVGLAVFAVDGWVVAAANRADLARAEVGAVQVLHVRASSPGALLSAVAAADPSGTQAMAAAGSDNGEGGLLAVDARRLGALSAWDPSWVGSTRSAIGPLLHPQQQTKPLRVRGRLTVTATYARTRGDSALRLGVAVRAASGLPAQVALGLLVPGTSTYSVDLPSCVDAPCTLTAFTFVHPVDQPATAVTGTVSLGPASDVSGPVDLTAPGRTGWRSGGSSLAPPIAGGAVASSVQGGRLTIEISPDLLSDAAIEVADHPVSLPVVQGSDLVADPSRSTQFPVVAGLDGRFVAITPGGSGVLPQLLRSGTLADLPYALALMGTPPNPIDYQVWLSPSASPAVRASLAAAGVEVLRVDSSDRRESELDRGGAALALRLFLVAALVALVLGAGTLLANAYVVIRRRAYELAALRALGARRSVLVRAGRREQVVLALAGVVLGAASGLVAAGVALPALLESAAAGPSPWFGPAWLPVAALLGAVLVLLVVVADVGARRTVRRALPELLRQVQE